MPTVKLPKPTKTGTGGEPVPVIAPEPAKTVTATQPFKLYPNGLPYRNYAGDSTDTRRKTGVPMV